MLFLFSMRTLVTLLKLLSVTYSILVLLNIVSYWSPSSFIVHSQIFMEVFLWQILLHQFHPFLQITWSWGGLPLSLHKSVVKIVWFYFLFNLQIHKKTFPLLKDSFVSFVFGGRPDQKSYRKSMHGLSASLFLPFLKISKYLKEVIHPFITSYLSTSIIFYYSFTSCLLLKCTYLSADHFPDMPLNIRVLFTTSYSLGADFDARTKLHAPIGSFATWCSSLFKTLRWMLPCTWCFAVTGFCWFCKTWLHFSLRWFL